MSVYTCDHGHTLPYTLVCDFSPDCPDLSDEYFCVHPDCPYPMYTCRNGQCVPLESPCDGRQDCKDRSDESDCMYAKNRIEFLPPPAVVEFDGYGSFSKTSMGEGERCPDTHFLCPGFYCLPVYVVCNGVYDCPGWEDEAGCDVFTCPGFYRCRHSAVCLHPRHLCDGVFQCPRHDDELPCDVSCPGGCRCQGLSAVCQHPFPVSSHRHFRFVDASGTNMSPVDFKLSLYLVSLRLARCQLRALLLSTLPNLQQLDLSDNLIGTVDVAVLVKVANLRQLRLSGNRISSITAGDISSKHWNFHLLDLSRNAIREFDSRPLSEFQSFRILNLTSNPVRTISEAGMRGVMRLEVLDLRHSPLETFPGDVFQGLTRLKKVYADNYKLCCRATLPEHLPPEDCLAPVDEISSCKDLLRFNVYRVCLWLFAAMAVVGNVGSVIFKLWLHKDAKGSSFNVFVVQLSVSDFLMGVYLVIIGAADGVYRGKYLWFDVAWKKSGFCKLAGFLSLLSSEVSVFIVCLITVDRFVVFKFPFRDVRFGRTSAHVACALAWLVGVTLAGCPLLPQTSHWEYYSQTGICIPLPITRRVFAGRTYSFSLMIVLNLILFLLIAAGQLFVYWSIHGSSMAVSGGQSAGGRSGGALNWTQMADRRERDSAIARRLVAVVVSDFLCWFPIGL